MRKSKSFESIRRQNFYLEPKRCPFYRHSAKVSNG